MARIVVFGAGGRAGRRVVAEAVRRGHAVTAAVRAPARYAGPTGGLVTVVAGDATDADSVAAAAAGHDAAVSAVHRDDVPAADLYAGAARALLAGLRRAGVGRLVVVGIGTVLEAAPGTPVHDTPGFPADGRRFSLGHLAGLDALRAGGADVDWVVLAPPPTFLDDESPGTGRYRTGGPQVVPPDGPTPAFAYADLALAVVDEATAPVHHRVLVAVAY